MLIYMIWSVATGGNKHNSPRYAIVRPFEKKACISGVGGGVQHKLIFRRLFPLGPRTIW